MNRKQTAYAVFLDVQKAFDKAWLDAILYVLNKNGVHGKKLSIIKIQAAAQSIMSQTGNQEFKVIKMEAMWHW